MILKLYFLTNFISDILYIQNCSENGHNKNSESQKSNNLDVLAHMTKL